jgi:hypothetical protein
MHINSIHAGQVALALSLVYRAKQSFSGNMSEDSTQIPRSQRGSLGSHNPIPSIHPQPDGQQRPSGKNQLYGRVRRHSA